MKKFGFILSMLAFASAAFAQEKSAIAYKNEGVEFMKVKKYQEALESYKQVITMQGDSADAVVFFNAAFCAQSVKDFDVAYQYYAKSIEKDYKAAESAFYSAKILKVQGKTEEYEKAMENGYKTYPNGKTGNAFKKEYAKVIRDKGVALYNAAADDLKAAQTAKADKLDALKASALAKFTEAKPFIDQSLEINPDDANAKNFRDGIAKQIEALQK